MQTRNISQEDLLIPESQFFPDPTLFEQVSEKLLPIITKHTTQQTPLRIWVAGCSGGQDIYSLLICLHERLEEEIHHLKIQLFGTDISERAIANARTGIYTKNELEGISQKRLTDFFVQINDNYQIHKNIRSSCVFAIHNYLKDPPFSNLDLLVCNHSLMSLNDVLQKRVLASFHYGLNDDGYLLMGTQEIPKKVSEFFTICEEPAMLYFKNKVKSSFLRGSNGYTVVSGTKARVSENYDEAATNLLKDADDEVMARFAPPGVVINSEMEIIQFRGSTGKWLESFPGKPTLNIFKMANDGLELELRNAINQAKETKNRIIKHSIPLQRKGKEALLTIDVIPLSKTAETHYLVLFIENEILLDTETSGVGDKFSNRDKKVIQQLQNKLTLAKEILRIHVEEHVSANEELQAANAELLSGSEELQSMNEELEVSKEEIQNTNEELVVLNQALYDRNEYLNILRLYAESIVATLREPLIILDKDFKVKNANPAFYKKFCESGETTLDKKIFELGNRQWDIPELKTLLENILPSRTTITEFEVTQDFPHIGNRIMLLNAVPVLRDDSDDQYILLVFEDVTEKRKIADQLKLFAEELESQVVERTESLRKANADLSYSNESLLQFAYIASHDLQEPLRKIKTFSGLLSDGFDRTMPDEAKVLLSKIVGSTDRMSALIYEVLEFSRVLHGDMIYQQVDLNTIIQENVNDYELTIREKNAKISWNNLPVIDGIPLQLRQLFGNLISNSLKFSHKGIPPIIDISSEILTLEEVMANEELNQRLPHCKINFRDNGIGFDPEFSDQVFLIFHRLHARSSYPGTGIGLALCKRIVLNHHGKIEVTTKEGEGTTFHIVMPIRQS